MTTEPTRERVEVYEKALGCQHDPYVVHPRPPFCQPHDLTLHPLGCPVAVAAARVEAERVAEVEADRDELRDEADNLRVTLARMRRERDDWKATAKYREPTP